METLIATYYESKKKAFVCGCIVFIPLVLSAINDLFFTTNDSVYTTTLIKSIILFIFIFSFLIYFYPTGILEIYRNGFMYKKGNFSLSSSWSEVNTIVFQEVRGIRTSRIIPTAFFIDTKNGTTKLIDTKILKFKGNKGRVDLVTFVQQLESISSKVIKWGDISTKKYSEVSFIDYLKGHRMI